MNDTTPEPATEHTWSLEGVLGAPWTTEEKAIAKVDPLYGLVQALFAALAHNTKALAAVSQALAEQQTRNAALVAAGRETSGPTVPERKHESETEAWSTYNVGSLRKFSIVDLREAFAAGYHAGEPK